MKASNSLSKSSCERGGPLSLRPPPAPAGLGPLRSLRLPSRWPPLAGPLDILGPGEVPEGGPGRRARTSASRLTVIGWPAQLESLGILLPAALAPLNLRMASLALLMEVYVTYATPSERPNLSYCKFKLSTGPIPSNNDFRLMATHDKTLPADHPHLNHNVNSPPSTELAAVS